MPSRPLAYRVQFVVLRCGSRSLVVVPPSIAAPALPPANRVLVDLPRCFDQLARDAGHDFDVRRRTVPVIVVSIVNAVLASIRISPTSA